MCARRHPLLFIARFSISIYVIALFSCTAEVEQQVSDTNQRRPDGKTSDGFMLGSDAQEAGVTTDSTQIAEPTLPPIEGFGRNTTGGFQAGSQRVSVTSLDDQGPGSLREVLGAASGPLLVTFQVDGTITLTKEISLPSHLTIDARGHQVTIAHKGFRIEKQQNVIILNLKFFQISGPGDAIMINSSHDIVVDHCLFDNEGLAQGDDTASPKYPDEFISVIYGSKDITLSWNKFLNNNKGILIGNGDAAPEVDGQITVTQHHNYFYNIGARHPHLRYGKVDAYNNVFHHWKLHPGPGTINYCVHVSENGQIILESNRFIQYYSWGPHYLLYEARALVVKTGGKVRAVNNSVKEKWDPVESFEEEKVFQRPYPAKIDGVNPVWIEMITNSTGNLL